MTLPDIKIIDYRVKVWLLVAGLLTIAALVIAAVRENYLTDWRMHQREYQSILKTKATDKQGKDIFERFDLRLRQAVVPELNAIDRCLTCHTGIDDPRMVDVPQPYKVHPGEMLNIHPPERFGCTVCHRGQGAAVTFAEAKAEDYFWDYPLLPKELTEASCGLCHTPHEFDGRGTGQLALGARLFEEKGCRGCHLLGGRGGSIGPTLDNEGLKIKHQLPMAAVEGPHTVPQWLFEHFRDPQQIVPGSQMNMSGLSDKEALALTTFMLAQQRRDLPRSYLSRDYLLALSKSTEPEALTGAEIYTRFCAACHGKRGEGIRGPGVSPVPAIGSTDFLAIAPDAFIIETVRRGRPSRGMPAWEETSGGLRDDEIASVVAHLRSLEEGSAWEPDPKPHRWVSGDAVGGARLFAAFCSGCHGVNGQGAEGLALNNPVILSHASDTYLYETIRRGRRGTTMESFERANLSHPALTPEEIESIVSHIRQWEHQP